MHFSKKSTEKAKKLLTSAVLAALYAGSIYAGGVYMPAAYAVDYAGVEVTTNPGSLGDSTGTAWFHRISRDYTPQTTYYDMYAGTSHNNSIF